MKLIHLSMAGLISVTSLWGQSFLDKLNTDFLTDTVTISTDSLTFELMDVNVVDNRPNKGKVFSISQGRKRDTMEFPDSTFKLKIKKGFNRFIYKYVPIDIIYELDKPLEDLIDSQPGSNGDSVKKTLEINHLEFGYDYSGRGGSRRVLNGQSQLKSPSGEILNEWQWDISLKRKKNEKLERLSGRVLEKWVNDQNEAIKSENINPISPYPYKRFIFGRLDYAKFPDGYRVDWHVSLNYPMDQQHKFEQGLPGFGVTYQRMDSYSIFSLFKNGKQKFTRLNKSFVSRLTYGYGVGIVNYDPDRFANLKGDHLYNINGFGAYNIEYRPQFHEGLYGGIGVIVDINP